MMYSKADCRRPDHTCSGTCGGPVTSCQQSHAPVKGFEQGVMVGEEDWTTKKQVCTTYTTTVYIPECPWGVAGYVRICGAGCCFAVASSASTTHETEINIAVPNNQSITVCGG